MSTRLELFENLLRVDKPTCSDVSVRLAQSFVERCAVCFIKPVPGIERQEIYFGSFWQIGGLVYDKSTVSNMCLDHHGGECNTGRAAQQNVAADKPRMMGIQFATVLFARLAAER